MRIVAHQSASDFRSRAAEVLSADKATTFPGRANVLHDPSRYTRKTLQASPSPSPSASHEALQRQPGQNAAGAGDRLPLLDLAKGGPEKPKDSRGCKMMISRAWSLPNKSDVCFGLPDPECRGMRLVPDDDETTREGAAPGRGLTAGCLDHIFGLLALLSLPDMPTPARVPVPMTVPMPVPMPSW